MVNERKRRNDEQKKNNKKIPKQICNGDETERQEGRGENITTGRK